MKVRFHPEANAELRIDAQYYESCRRGLGKRFTDAIRSAVEKVKEDPARYPKYELGTQRHVLRRFPYQIIYLHHQDTVIVLAVMHCSREPSYWSERVN